MHRRIHDLQLSQISVADRSPGILYRVTRATASFDTRFSRLLSKDTRDDNVSTFLGDTHFQFGLSPPFETWKYISRPFSPGHFHFFAPASERNREALVDVLFKVKALTLELRSDDSSIKVPASIREIAGERSCSVKKRGNTSFYNICTLSVFPLPVQFVTLCWLPGVIPVARISIIALRFELSSAKKRGKFTAERRAPALFSFRYIFQSPWNSICRMDCYSDGSNGDIVSECREKLKRKENSGTFYNEHRNQSNLQQRATYRIFTVALSSSKDFAYQTFCLVILWMFATDTRVSYKYF